MGKKIRRSDVKKGADVPKKTAKKAVKKKKKRFVLVCEVTYVVFGPFSEEKAVAYLKTRNFVHGKGDSWSNADKGVQIFLKAVKRPPLIQREDHPITLLRPDGL
jgi:hypothetical protein